MKPLYLLSLYFRYKTPPRAILRHIILSDFKEKVPLAPFINKETEPILMYDPLPPLDTINIYERPTLPTTSRLLPDTSPLSMFFQSLLPNFNVQNSRFVAPEALAGDGQNVDEHVMAAAGAAPRDPNNPNGEVLLDELRLIEAINYGNLLFIGHDFRGETDESELIFF